MSQANTCFEIFRGNAPRSTLARFCETFGPYPWVRLVGLPEIIGTLYLVSKDTKSVLPLQSLIRDELKTAANGIAAEGEQLFPKGDWASCNGTQLGQALANKPMCIEKAIIVARAAELACRKAIKKFAVPEIDVYQHLSIHVCNCVLEGLDEWQACQKWPRRFFDNEFGFLGELETKLRPHVKKVQMRRFGKAAEPNRTQGFDVDYDVDQFVGAVIEGKAITWKNAQLLKSAFDAVLESKTKVRVLTSRVSETGLQECNAFEAPFVGLSLDELNALRCEVKLGALSA